ncbi:MAG: hypothetical protein ACJ765_02080 [Chloroflexota bacterium]
MAEQRGPFGAMDDTALEAALRDLGPAIAYPAAVVGASDIASLVRQRIVAAPPAPAPRGILGWVGARPLRRSLLIAAAALLILAAVAGAIGLGLPGIRIIFGGPTALPSAPSSVGPTPAVSQALGMALGLGAVVPLEDAERIAGMDFILPTDPEIGAPDVSYILVNRAALVWSGRPGLPADPETGVGLLLNEFRGAVDEGYYTKALDSGTRVTQVEVNGKRGYWIDGSPHFFYYIDPTGRVVEDSHREVGDALIWSDGDHTYRLESQLGMEAAIQLAESLR